MRLLLDTHVFLWWVTDDARLSLHARNLITDGENDVFFSAVSGWEIAIKAGLGRLTLPEPLEEFIIGQVLVNALNVLPMQLAHALRVSALPDHHRDPFDRLLVAQAQVEDLVLVTNDGQLTAYEDQVRLAW